MPTVGLEGPNLMVLLDLQPGCEALRKADIV
jgi:hypothetical protein